MEDKVVAVRFVMLMPLGAVPELVRVYGDYNPKPIF